MSSSDLRNKYAFVGVGVTKQGKLPQFSADDLATQAIQLALADAGMKKSEVDGYIYQPGAGLSTVTPLSTGGYPCQISLAASDRRRHRHLHRRRRHRSSGSRTL